MPATLVQVHTGVTMREITACRGCGSSLLDVVFTMEPMPLAGAFANSISQAHDAERLPLTWVRCEACDLVQVLEDVEDKELYSKYCYASSTVPGLVEHFAEYAKFLTDRFRGKDIRVLEIGCNDGILLRRLPWKCVGVDPSDVAATTNPSAYELINEPFGTALGLTGFDLVIASNCLAHVTAIQDMVEAAAKALVPGGEFWVEVHDLEATLRTGQWDTIYHEHKAEYSLGSLSKVVTPHGFSILYWEKLPLHGGLLRVGFIKDGRSNPVGLPSQGFELLCETYRTRRETDLYKGLYEVQQQGKTLVAYGAAGRATVWFNQLPELRFAAVIDDSPLRAGRFVPGVGWPIVSWPGPTSDICVITAWNYAKEIRDRREYSGRWLQTWEAE